MWYVRSMSQRFPFEVQPVYQESMAFAYACMRRAQVFPATYGVYGEQLCRHSVRVSELIAAELQTAGEHPDFSQAYREAVACIPLIDLASTAGLLREDDRNTLRQRLARLLEILEYPGVKLTLCVQEKAQ